MITNPPSNCQILQWDLEEHFLSGEMVEVVVEICQVLAPSVVQLLGPQKELDFSGIPGLMPPSQISTPTKIAITLRFPRPSHSGMRSLVSIFEKALEGKTFRLGFRRH